MGVAEHDHLPTVLGPQWKDMQKRKMAAWRQEYFQHSWQQLRECIDAAKAEARPDVRFRLLAMSLHYVAGRKHSAPQCVDTQWFCAAGKERISEGALQTDQCQAGEEYIDAG